MPDHRVVVVGGGFGGLYTARFLRRVPVRVTLVDRRNFHLFQPLLYQVATGGLSPAEITAPLRAVLKRLPRLDVLMAEVTGIDAPRRVVQLADGSVPYDTLVLATGATHHYFGHDAWAAHAGGLKTVEDATRIRARILTAFESAERSRDEAERRRLLTFTIVGAGPTGVELAGAIGELAHHTLRRDFRRFDPRSTRIVLLDGADRVLPTFDPRSSRAAAAALTRLGVEVRTGARVVDITAGQVRVESGTGTETIDSATMLWGAGVRASPLASALAASTGAATDTSGRVVVAPDCSVPGRPEIFVIGDMARLEDAAGRLLPGVAPVAMQQGRHVARAIADRLRGRSTRPFRYRDRGSLAVIGRAAAVAELGRFRFTGYPAWLLWLFVHILYLVEFEHRLLVLVQWGYSYFTRKRGARLITLDPSAPAP
jgi:NADH dehydrogenase